MASVSEEEEILEAAVAGLPRVAEAVASIPEGDRAKALEAAESAYRQVVQDLGYEAGSVESWVSTIMLQLKTELNKQELAKQTPTQTVQEEFVPAESELEPDPLSF